MTKILLLEDDLSLLNGLSFAFKKQGYELDIAKTLKEAGEIWMDGKYDLLVLDVSLPDGTGFEFCEKVRQVSTVPIIFLTASDEEINIIMGLDMGQMIILQNHSNWECLSPGSTLCFDVQIHSIPQTQNCSQMGSRCFCCRDRLSKTGNCWILLPRSINFCACL